MNPLLKFIIGCFIGVVLAGGIQRCQEAKREKIPTVEVYASVELISGEQVPRLFLIPEDFYTLEIRPRRGEFWLVATTPRGDVRLMPGVIYIHKFTRQIKQGK